MKKRGKINNKNISKKKSGFKIDQSYFILLRYIILLCLMFSLPIIYMILTPITKYSSVFLLNIFFKDVFVEDNFIIINFRTIIDIVPACVAGSAYLLLLILNLSVKMDIKKRLTSLIFSILILFVFNVIRIFGFSIAYYYDLSFIDLTHKIFWIGISTVFVIAIWFMNVKIFLIKEIPIYTDIRFLIANIKKKKS